MGGKAAEGNATPAAALVERAEARKTREAFQCLAARGALFYDEARPWRPRLPPVAEER